MVASYKNDRGSTTLVRLVHVRICVLVTLNKTRHFSRIRPENYYCNNVTEPNSTMSRRTGVRNPRRTCTRCTLHGSNGRSDSRAISFLLGGTNHSNRHISRAYHWPGAVWHVVVCIWVHIPACYLALELPGLLTTRDNRIPGLISPTVSHLHTTSPRIRGTDIAGRSHMAHA